MCAGIQGSENRDDNHRPAPFPSNIYDLQMVYPNLRTRNGTAKLHVYQASHRQANCVQIGTTRFFEVHVGEQLPRRNEQGRD